MYRDNVEYIEATNRRGDLSYELGENEFADLTQEEFLARYTSYSADDDMAAAIRTRTAGSGDADLLWSSGELEGDKPPPPTSVDWRAKGAVTPPKSQSSSCCT